MIITCPKCFSKYEVADGAIAANGRVVRCASCAMEWVAYPGEPTGASAAALDETMSQVGDAVREAVDQFDIDSHLVEQDLAGDDDQPDSADADIDAMFMDELDDYDPAPEPAEDVDVDDIDFDAIDTSDEEPDLSDGDLSDGLLGGLDEEEDFMTRRRLQELDRDDRERSHRSSRLVTGLWGLWLVVVIAIIAVLVFAKDTVTSRFPGMNQLYDFAASLSDPGMESDKPAFTRKKPRMLGFQPDPLVRIPRGADTWLTVSGSITNKGEQSISIAKIIVVIQDETRRPLAEWDFDPDSKILRRGSILKYSSTIGPLPDGAQKVDIDVRFSDGKRYSDIVAARNDSSEGGQP